MVEKEGKDGDAELRDGTTNIVSWNGKVLPETLSPERPVVAGKLIVKG